MSVLVKDANGSIQTLSTTLDASGYHVGAVSLDSPKATYRASASFTPLPTAARTLFSLKGSASKTVRVTKVLVGGVSTAAASVIAQMIRASAAGTGGTAVNPTVAKLNSGSAAATAVPTHYTTAAQTAGTSTDGPLRVWRLVTEVVTTPTLAIGSSQLVFPEMGDPATSSIILSGTSDILEIQNTAGNLSTATVLEYVIEWAEE